MKPIWTGPTGCAICDARGSIARAEAIAAAARAKALAALPSREQGASDA